MVAYLSFLAFLILTLTSVFGQEGCQFSPGNLKCTLLGSNDFTAFLPAENREMVRWMTLSVGTSTNKHSDNSQPITYPDWSQFPRLSFLLIYIHSTTPAPNYVPDNMFEGLNGALTVLRLFSPQPIPINVRFLTAESQLEKLKSLRLTNFNISGVTSINLGGLSNLETLELINTESGDDKESVLLDSVFRISKALPKLSRLSLKNFEFIPLFSVRGLLTPLPRMERLTLEAGGDSSGVDVSVFFDNTIFPALESLELTGFGFSQISDPTPPLTRLKLRSNSVRPFSLATLSTSTLLRELYLTNFNLGNLTVSSFRGLTSLQKLYLTGSEDTIVVSDDTFSSSSQLTHLRISKMPNLILLTERSLIGLHSLTYLHIGTLNSLRTLDVDTSSLNQLSSLYITSNRDLSEIPVRFFRPLSALEMLNVRSNKFDEDCECRHSYLASLLTYSRADPRLVLRSSCQENREFDKCRKNYQNTLCWDFEERCEDQCLPSGNLSYACVCPAGMGQLGTGGKCVDLSRCSLTSNGVTSHHCYLNKFTCAINSRNSTISCSCYTDHAIHPGGLGCVSVSSCTLQGGKYVCGERGLICSEGICECMSGSVWNVFSKTCVSSVTPIPTTSTMATTKTPTTRIITTLPTSTSTNTPVITTLPDTTIPTPTPITTTVSQVNTIETTVATTTARTTLPADTLPSTSTTSVADTTPVPTTGETDTTTPQLETTSTPQLETTSTPQLETTSTPQLETTSTPQLETTSTPQLETTSTPRDTSSTPRDTTQTPRDTTQTPLDTTQTPRDTTQTPLDTTQIPLDTTQTPLDTTQMIQETTPTTTITDISTEEPTDPKTTTTDPNIQSSTTRQEPVITPIPQLQPLQANVAYIVGFTLGGICIGGLILLATSLVIVFLVKIFLHSNGGKYKIVGNKSKPDSLRSFGSSNSSATPTKSRELSV